ncbi:Holliday junction ATP-dependent DNA helicase RuvA (plasmid) [Streptococcus dysgalactiae]|nr:Holliday junction ATP-dependent DNA helicase RuvA [Streptococcus dysgalactiae]
MVLDLAGKFVEVPQETSKAKPSTSSNNDQLDEAIEALLALGYKATELKKIRAFFEGTSETAEQYIKSALKLL